MQRMVDDETWVQLDRDAGALTRRQRRRAYVGLLLAVLLAGSGYGLWDSGLLRPHLVFDQGSYGWNINAEKHTFVVTLRMVNRGARTEHVRGAGRSGLGLRLLDVHPRPVDVAAHGEVEVNLTYRVTDCDQVQRGRWPVPVSVNRGGPDQIVNLQPPDLDPMIEDADGEQSEPVTDLPWQEALSAHACAPPDQD